MPLKALVAHAANSLDVLSTGDFGHHAAKARMEIDLRRHHIGKNHAIAVDDGGGCFVARTFDGKDERSGERRGLRRRVRIHRPSSLRGIHLVKCAAHIVSHRARFDKAGRPDAALNRP